MDGNHAVELAADGSPAAPADGDLTGETVNPLSSLPDLSMFPSILEAFGGSGGDPGPQVRVLANSLADLNAQSAELPQGITARLIDGTHFELSVANADRSAADQPRVVASFVKVGDAQDWVLRELSETTNVTEAGQRVSMRHAMAFNSMRIVRNVNADRRRRAARSKRFETYRDAVRVPAGRAQPNAPTAVNATVATTEGWRRTGLIAWNPPVALPFPTISPTQGIPIAGYAPDRTEEEVTQCNPSTFAADKFVPAGGGNRVVFQHGIRSSACTWAYLAPQFAAEYGPGGMVVGNTASMETYEAQASALRAQIPTGTGGWIFVGHSNGGVVSRHIAQTQTSQLAKAVITINSPHSGAPIIANVQSAVSSLRWIAPVANAIYARRSVGVLSMAALVGRNTLLQTFYNGGSVLPQMIPGSTFITAANSRPEAAFRRFSIRSEIASQWQAVRTLCDNREMIAPGVPQGRSCVNDTKREVKRNKMYVGLFALLAIVSSRVPWVNNFSSTFAYESVAWATLTSLQYFADWTWRQAFDTYQPSDGVVPLNSQHWPGIAPADERTIPLADSHVGSTKSNLVRTALAIALGRAAAE